MNEYLKLAEALEKDNEVCNVSLEKIAAICLLHEYFNNPDFSILKSPALMKCASSMLEEDNLALTLGVEIGIKSIVDKEF